MKRYSLWEEKPAGKFSDAYYLGNGRLGLTVMGGVPLEEIGINDDTLWSGSEKFYLNPRHYESFEKARALALEGNVKEANQMINEEMEGRWFETYLPLASLHIMNGQPDNRRNMPLKMVIEPQQGDITEYMRRLDLSDAVETVSWVRDHNRYSREYYVSYPRDAAFVCLRGAKEDGGDGKVLNFAFGLDSHLHYEYGTRGQEAWLTGIAPDHAEPSYTSVAPGLVYGREEESKALRFACCVRVLASDGEVSADGARVYVRDASYALLAITAKTNYAGFRKPRDNSRERLLCELCAQLDGMEGMTGEKLKAEHIEDYRALYDRVDIDLGRELTGNLPTSSRLKYCAEGVDDPSLAALMLQYVRYLTIAGSRPGSQALNLQGIWNDTTMPPWSSNYTNNINVQMNYWPCEELGLPECHLPMMDLIGELSQNGRKTAEGYYHMGGWVTHHNADLWRSCEPSCEDASWSWWPFGGAWMCQHIWTHYEFTGDRDFLRRMYPVLREAAVFMLDFLSENRDGYLVTAPSLSPENKYIWQGGEDTVVRLIDEVAKESRCSPNDPDISAVTVGSTMDMSILRELFSNVIAAADILDIREDEVAERAGEAMKKFPPYKTGRYGQLIEWYDDVEECTPGMSHISQMYPVYPGNLFTEHKNPELFEAAHRSLERRNLHAKKQGGWPGAWRIALMARFHDSLECGHILKSTGEGLGAGMMTDVHQQIDAIFGLGAGIGEMLLQSHQEYIELLPAVTVDWANGSFRGLRARGGFAVSAEWKSGRLVRAEIRSLLGGRCRVKAQGLRSVCAKDGGYLAEAEDGFAEFDTCTGSSYFLDFEENEIASKEYFV